MLSIFAAAPPCSISILLLQLWNFLLLPLVYSSSATSFPFSYYYILVDRNELKHLFSAFNVRVWLGMECRLWESKIK